MKTLILLSTLLAASCAGQVTAMFKPLSIGSTQAAIGRGRDIGVWTVSVCNDGAAPIVLPRERVLFAAPAIHDLPNHPAEDILKRKAARDPRSVWARALQTGSGLSSDALIAGGITTGTHAAVYAGIGVKLLGALLTSAKAAAPDPEPYYSDLLPARIGLAGLECNTWILAAALTRNAQSIGPLEIRLPGSRP